MTYPRLAASESTVALNGLLKARSSGTYANKKSRPFAAGISNR